MTNMMDHSEHQQHTSTIKSYPNWKNSNQDRVHEISNPKTYGLITKTVNIAVDALTPLSTVPENLDHMNLSGNYAIDSLGM